MLDTFDRRETNHPRRPSGGGRRSGVLGLLTALLAAGLLTAPAGSVMAQSPRVEVRVTIIHASNEGDEVDPRLEDLQRQLAAFSFTSYKLLDIQLRTLPFGTPGRINLPGERILTITPQRRDSEGRLRLRLTIGELIDTTYTIAEGASIIIGGPRHEGGHLILAVHQTAAR